MEWYTVGLGLLGLLMLFIVIGLPIPFALAAASLPFLWDIQGWKTSVVSSELKLWGVWIDYILLAVPLFVFLGELIGKSNIGPNLYQFLHQGVRLRGSAAYGSIGASAGFGAVCGSSMVGALTIGGVALPEMLRLGYGKRLSSGVLAAGGTLSGFVIVVLVWGKLKPEDIPSSEESAKMPMAMILSTVGPVALIGLVITVAIYAGIATPTEAAAVAALLTVILAFGVGGLTFDGFKAALFSTMRTMIREAMENGVLAIVIVFYIVLGMFLEPVSMTFITLPTIFPLMSAAGFDLIWFGVVYTITMEIAVLTPPVGLT